MIPCVYFFYPETAYRSLEEMDAIFRKTTSYLGVVSIARKEPRRYGKKGELLIAYEETEEFAIKDGQRASVSGRGGSVGAGGEVEKLKGGVEKVEKV